MELNNVKKARSEKLETKLIKFSEAKLAPNESAAEIMEFNGYGAVFGNVDAYGDVIQKGAFTAYLNDVKSGKQDWPAMLTQHGGWAINANDLTPVGVYTDLTEDDFGLKTVGNLAPTARGKEIHALMKMQPRPAISGLSIGYFVKEFERGNKLDGYDRLLKRIDVVEISIVTFPANEKARVSGVKSSEDYTEREFELFLRDSGFSKKEAQKIIAEGFRSLKNQWDADQNEINSIADYIRKNTQLIKA